MLQPQITATPKLFIGMDIHKKSWSVHLRTDLFDHKGFSMPPDSSRLADYVTTHFSDHEVSLLPLKPAVAGFLQPASFSIWAGL